LQLSRTVYRYESVARDQSALEMRIKEITEVRVHYGAPRVYVMQIANHWRSDIGQRLCRRRERVPSAEIEIRRAGTDQTEVLLWKQNEPAPAELAAAAVFDARCATAFTDAEGDVAYTPRGLDILAGLAALCARLRTQIETEANAITASSAVFADLNGEHVAGRLLVQFEKKFTNQAYRQDLKTLATLSDAELAEIDQLAVQLAETDPAARAIEIRRLKTRVVALVVQWEQCEAALSDEKAQATLKSGLVSVEADVVAKLAAEAFAAQGEMLPGTGSEPWLQLLAAARDFSTQAAYLSAVVMLVIGARFVEAFGSGTHNVGFPIRSQLFDANHPAFCTAG